MPTKKKSANATARELPSIPQELIEQSPSGSTLSTTFADATQDL
ncbi:hypothetical protein [Pseudomonas savastanoi]|nr:hypothetical protein [Pseudomonas savastanoi]EFW80540.1 ISPsy18, transposase [Pseudomonas savastanoi pv. glycinea str. B076]